MSAGASPLEASAVPSIWRDSAGWIRAADVAVVLLVISLPWSTSLVAIFAVAWVILLVPTFDLQAFREAVTRPAGTLPILLVALAVLGMLWATDIPWGQRLHGINPAAKLLAIPVLMYHFSRSGRGLWIALAFLASCTVVMLLSWAMFIDPQLAFDPVRTPGVPVKNYIVQGQEFTLCAFGALGAAMYALARQRKALAATLVVLSLGFVANMVFVASSRTALVCLPVMFVVFAAMFFSRRGLLVLLIGAVVAGILAWNTSPYLRYRADAAWNEYRAYRETNAVTSTGQRLEYWRKSLKFVEAAPLFGHGTGSTRTLFERDAVGQTGVSAEIIGNPHNQTLNVAVQWGLLGCIILYAMWFKHLMLFVGRAGLAAWMGLLAVAENFTSSLLNSHLFDFAEGWIYVLAVGVAGGMVLRGISESGAGAPTVDAGQAVT